MNGFHEYDTPQSTDGTIVGVRRGSTGTVEVTVEFRRSGRTVAWDADAPSLLAFAEAQGLKPDFSCRSGVCSTCTTRLLAGEVRYFEAPLDPPEAGTALICCSKPKSSVVLDL